MKKPIVKRLFKYIKPYKAYVIGALLSAVISIALSLYVPILIGNAIDFIIGKNNVDYKGVIKIIVILSAVALTSAFFQWLVTIFTNKITYNTVVDLRADVFNKINKLPLKYIDKTPHGDITNRIVNDVDFVSDGLLQGMTQLFTGAFTILGTLFFMLTINLTIALVVVLITPLSIFVAMFIAKRMHKAFITQSVTQGELSGYITEMISNQKVVKAFNFEARSQKKFEKINKKLYDCGQKAQFSSSLSNPSTRFVNGIVYAAVGIIGSIGAINGKLTIGQISSFLAYANQYTKPFNEVTGILTQLQTAFSALQRLFAILDEEIEPQLEAEEVEIKNCKGNIIMKNVDFSYNPNTTLIKNLNLEIKQGDKIAIVGPTGSGKTTIVNLLMRFYDINSGEIFIDGVNIKDMSRGNLRKLFGMVLQDTWLFNGSIKENISFGMPDASMEDIINAAKAAHAHAFIERLPDGYDTVIKGDGNNISSGQKQLLSIARIMLTHPPMLILDEATSSIDTRTEIEIQKAFNKIMEGRTSFIVAHRLSTIREADVILVMQSGNVVEQGNHKELLAKNGFYANLYNSQFSVIN